MTSAAPMCRSSSDCLQMAANCLGSLFSFPGLAATGAPVEAPEQRGEPLGVPPPAPAAEGAAEGAGDGMPESADERFPRFFFGCSACAASGLEPAASISMSPRWRWNAREGLQSQRQR